MPKHRKNNKMPLHFMKPPDMKQLMEAMQLRKASFAYRHELLLHTQRINYKNEYDRIRGMLDRTNLPAESIPRLQARRDRLHHLITENLYPARH